MLFFISKFAIFLKDLFGFLYYFLLTSLCACLCSFLLTGENTLEWTKIGN